MRGIIVQVREYTHFSILYLLESKYLDNNVKPDTRDDFTIYPKRKNSEDLFANISWEEINENLKIIIRQIAKENKIDLEELAKTNLQKAYQKAPYLGYYLDNNDLKDIRKNDKIDYSKLSKVTQSELAEYIFDREKVIEKLKNLTDEKAINDYRTNHLWLFDDRFMTYDKVFSDKQIKEIFPKLSENLDRPDLLSIVSNTYEKEKMTDIVIIELKRPNDKITPAGAEEQLLDYASYINENFEDEDRKIRIWTYAFLKFDKATERRLSSKGYNRVFTNTEYPLYYLPYPNENAIINFIDYKTIAYDAELRNKTFLKILKGKTLLENE